MVKVGFVYSQPYDRKVLSFLGTEWDGENQKHAEERIIDLEREWAGYEQRCFSEMENATGMMWKQDPLVYVVTRQVFISEPTTISVVGPKGLDYPIDLLIDKLVHELIHVFFTQNSTQNLKIYKWLADESADTRMHVYLHALHKHLYLTIFGEDRLRRDVDFEKGLEEREGPKASYSRSWEIVGKEGHEKLLEKLRTAVGERGN